MVGPRLFSICGAIVDNQTGVNSVWVFDVDEGAWLQGADAPLALMGSATAVYDGSIYLTGGKLPDGSISTAMYRLDLD